MRLSVREEGIEGRVGNSAQQRAHFLSFPLHPTWNVDYDPPTVCADCGREGVEGFVGPGGVEREYLCANESACRRRTGGLRRVGDG